MCLASKGWGLGLGSKWFYWPWGPINCVCSSALYPFASHGLYTLPYVVEGKGPCAPGATMNVALFHFFFITIFLFIFKRKWQETKLLFLWLG